VDLWEVSLRTCLPNDASRITTVKGCDPEEAELLGAIRRFGDVARYAQSDPSLRDLNDALDEHAKTMQWWRLWTESPLDKDCEIRRGAFFDPVPHLSPG